MKRWTAKDIEKLNKKPVKKPKKRKSEGKTHIEQMLRVLEIRKVINSFDKEYRFAAVHVGLGKGIRKRLENNNLRDWRFDWCIHEYKIAIEYEGIMQGKSRHTNIEGYSVDCEKYNAAQILGWKVLRYTAKNYQNIYKDLETLCTNTKN